MLLILVEVFVKVASWSTATDCSHRATSMLLVLVEVSVKVACQSTTLLVQSYHHATYSGVSVKVSYWSTGRLTQFACQL